MQQIRKCYTFVFMYYLFIDLRKVSDTINHRILAKKLEHYRIRGISSKWITSYMTNRKQYVNIEDTFSEYKEILCGVPQGSILGPKSLIIYINDICNISSTLKSGLFADDVNICSSGYGIDDICVKVNSELCSQ